MSLSNYTRMSRSTKCAGVVAGMLVVALLATSLGPSPILSGDGNGDSMSLPTTIDPVTPSSLPGLSEFHGKGTTNIPKHVKGIELGLPGGGMGSIVLSSEDATLVEAGQAGKDDVVRAQSRRFAGQGKVTKKNKMDSSSTSKASKSFNKSDKSSQSTNAEPEPLSSNSDHHPPGRRNKIRKKWRKKREDDRKKKENGKKKPERWRRRPKWYRKKKKVTPAPTAPERVFVTERPRTADPTPVPTARPRTARPSPAPTIRSSSSPSISPSTPMPSARPSLRQSASPSFSPSSRPSRLSSNQPSMSTIPSQVPTSRPSVSSTPSRLPTLGPSTSAIPSQEASSSPSASVLPSAVPSPLPSTSSRPSPAPSLKPSVSSSPSLLPSPVPSTSLIPSVAPTSMPSASPYPSSAPSPTPLLPVTDDVFYDLVDSYTCDKDTSGNELSYANDVVPFLWCDRGLGYVYR